MKTATSMGYAALARKTYAGVLRTILLGSVGLFVAAGTFNYWQAWQFILLFSVITIWMAHYFLTHAPMLLERRQKAGPFAEKERSQKYIMAAATVLFILLVLIPGLERHAHLLTLPAWLVYLGDLLVVAGYAIIFFTFRTNHYAAAIIEVSEGQRVIFTGPYAFVRHPMYSGGILLIFGVTLALGSLWGLWVSAALTAMIILRLREEEKYLSHRLTGYTDYCARVRSHLVPYVY